MKKKKINLLFLSLFICFLNSCINDTKEKKVDTIREEIEKITVPEFNQDSAFKFLQEQINFGPRVLGSTSANECAKYFEKKFNEWADTLIIQQAVVRTFNDKTFNAKNFIASFNLNNENRVMLSAHWDSRPFADRDENPDLHNKPIDGANDAASGVAVLMELARIMSIEKPEIGIDIILFDAEDYGATEDVKHKIKNSDYTWGLGSQYWAKNPHVFNYKPKYGILLDMVGNPEPNFAKEAFSLQYAPDIVNKVWNIAAYLGYSNIFTEQQTGYIMDDHYFVNKYANIPMIDIIHHDPTTSTGFFPYWHTSQDNIDNIDINTLKIVGNTMVNVIWREK